MHRLIALVLVLASASGLMAEHVCRYCQAAAASGGATTPKYAPDRVVDVRHIKIEVTPDFAEKTVHATTTLTFAPISEPTRVVELNAVLLSIEKVESTRALAEHFSTDDKLTLLFAEPIAVGEEVEVAITYTAEPKKGLYFRTSDMGYPEGEDHLWTQGETHEAPHWFPCFDYPNERSTTEIICHVPADMTVLSNGKRLSEEASADGIKSVHWRQDKPHVNYLICLVAGHFHSLSGESNGVPLGFYTQPMYTEQAANSFQDTAAILRFYEQEIGVKYPWDKYDQVTIRDYFWGGMENTTMTTLTLETLFDDQTENLRSSRGLDAHELAHQWFGDYVTCKDWSHLWLNEGFATFYTHLYHGHKLGRDEMLYGLYRDANEKVLPGSKENSKPIVYRSYAQPWDQFDFRAYPKGSWVLHMLRSRVGDELFRRAIRLYLERHALSSVVTDDLRQAFEEVTGKPLDAFFDQWAYHGGVPNLKVTHKWLPEDKLLRITVKQDEPKDRALLFTFPVTLRAHIEGGEPIDRRVEINAVEQDFYLSLPSKPTVVRFDPEYTLLARIDHTKPQQMLREQLSLKDDMIGRLLAAKALGKKDSKQATEVLAKALNDDAFYAVRMQASKSLGEQETDAALEALLASQQQTDARVRQQVVEDLGDYYDERAEAALLAVAKNEANPDIRGLALKALAKYPTASEAIREGLGAESFQNHLALAAATAAGKSFDPELAEPLLEMLRSRRFDLPSRRLGDALKPMARVWREAEDQAPAREFLVELLSDPHVSVQMGAIEALGELGDRRVTPLLAALAGDNGKIGPVAKKALKKLDEQATKAPEAVKKLREQVRELKEQQEKLEKTVERLEAKKIETSD